MIRMTDSVRRREIDQRVTIALVLLTAIGLAAVGVVIAVSGNLGFGAYLAALGLALLVFGLRAVKRGIPDGRPSDWAWKSRVVLGVVALVLALVFYLLDR